MLYDRWRQVVQDHGGDFALSEIATGRRWSFKELDQAVDQVPSVPSSIVYPQGNSAEFILSLLQAWKTHAVVCPLEMDQNPLDVPIPPAPCIHLKTTSASTGAPRGIAFTEEQLAADVENIIATMELRADSPNLGVISMSHSYGFSHLALPLVLHGIPLILAPSPLPESVRQAAQGWHGLTLPAVPALWRAWHEARAIPPNIRLAISAGAPMPVALEQSVFAVHGLKIHNFYGSSECGGISYDPSDAPRTDDAYVGTPMRNVHLSINDTGCLCVRSRAVGQTYWPEPAPSLADGLFQTSDLAELKDGQVYLRGRLNDLINVAGRKVAPEAIEIILRRHPGIRECLVFGIPASDGERSESIVACVSAQSGVTEEILRQYMLAQVPAWQAPREWWFVEGFPANERGKSPRAAWRKRFLEARGRDTL